MAEHKQPRNANAAKRQREYRKETTTEQHQLFADRGLTKRNEDFMFQLNKQLEERDVAEDKKRTALEQTLQKLLAEQKSGKTAKQLFGTTTQAAEEIIAGPKKEITPNSSFWALTLDNGLMFFTIFAFLFGFMMVFSPATTKATQSGTTGITAIVLVAVSGGMLFAWITNIITPRKREDAKPIWQRVLYAMVGLFGWVLLYFAVSLLPPIINPQLPGIVYLVLGALGFTAQIYIRRRFNIVGGVFQNQRRNPPRGK